MAQQPADISAILAALQSQRPNATPGQQPAQPGIPFSNGLPTPNSSGTVPLPTPSNSGNLDLSSIRPVNSGSMSMNDSSKRGRSRSPRRDNYRDGYNPYRDERREDRRGGGARDRSMSPGRAHGGRTSRGDDPDVSDVIEVDSNAVGLIIGRAGENMRRIESESGARVQFITGPEGSGPKRRCRVTGTQRQRAEAVADIYRSQAENHRKNSGQQAPTPIPAPLPPPRQASTPTQQPPLRQGERSSQIMVPDKTVGLIIGRGGETIRDLQERSGCHVNITSENKSINGYRPVNLIGTDPQAKRAREMIYEIVDSDTRNSQAQQGQSRRDQHQPPPAPIDSPNYGPSQYANTPADPYGQNQPKYTEHIHVPSEAVGMIIGKGGETIKDMQSTSGCKINVSQPQGADIQRPIELFGSQPAITHAKRLIDEKVTSVREKQGGGGGSRGANSSTPAAYGGGYRQPNMQGYNPSMQPQGLPPQPAEQPNDPYAPWGGYNAYAAMWQQQYQHPPRAQ